MILRGAKWHHRTLSNEVKGDTRLHALYSNTTASRIPTNNALNRIIAHHSWAQIQLPMSSERSWIAGDALTMSRPAKGFSVELPAMFADRLPLDRRRVWYEPKRNTGSTVKVSSTALHVRDQQLIHSRLEAEHMFYHGYDNYIQHAFPEDELRPLTCRPLTRDRSNPAHIELNDALGNYSLTLIDSLSTLAILASSPDAGCGRRSKALSYFQSAIGALVEQYGDGTGGGRGQGSRARGFDLDSKVQVFETVIRGVGGLLSAHEFAVGELPITGYTPIQTKAQKGEDGGIQWPNGFVYNGQLLRLALDLASRLLPAFYTSTGIPYPRVNLRTGIPFYSNSPLNHDAEHGTCRPGPQPGAEVTETCSAGAGSLVLELATLSRLTGNPSFELVAKRAFWAIWERRSAIGLIGSGIDAETGHWTSPFTGLGAGIDSFFEYALKSYILLSGASEDPAVPGSPSPTASNSTSAFEQRGREGFFEVWQEAHAAINRHLRRGDNYIHPHYIQADLYTGAARGLWFDSLSAFFPGLLTLAGNVEEAIESHLLMTAVWTRYSALPERWSVSSGSIEGGLKWWGGRPEFIESTYHIYRATQDPWYLRVAEMVLRDIKRRCWTKCGWAGIQDVRSGERSDRMESFFLGETIKYLLLIFDPDHPLNKLDAPFVFTTEGHPLILPRRSRRYKSKTASISTITKDTAQASAVLQDATCPVPAPKLPFSISATAARGDIFHAANLARLHLMPKPDTIDSPLVEYSRDHPSISISDVRSPTNYTYYPWTLPPELIPHNATCTKITSRPTFDITFPTDPTVVLNPSILQRVLNGILVNSMSGIRFNMIQDVPTDPSSGGQGDLFRVQAINNILLGKDEKVFLPRDVVSSVVNAQDPNFSRVRDTSMLDLVVDVKPGGPGAEDRNTSEAAGTSLAASVPELVFEDAGDSKCDSSSPMRLAFNSLMQHVSSLIHEAQAQAPAPDQPVTREYLPAIAPTGAGTAPIPDVEEALGPDITGAPRGALLWNSIYIGDQNCNSPLPSSVPRDHQILVLRRGGCFFSQKLKNIPTYAPSKTSLQMVVVVSYEQDDEKGLPAGWLTRPLLEGMQMTPKGLPRRNPIVMVLVGGGEETIGNFRRAVGVGVRRRYVVQAQGVVVSNLIIT